MGFSIFWSYNSFFLFIFFFFNDTATTEIYTLSLHDALPISDFGQIVGPHIGGAASILPMYDQNIVGGQQYVRIWFSYLGIVPSGDRAEEDACERLRGEVKLLDDPRHIIDWNIGADCRRKVKDLAVSMGAKIQQLCFVQRAVGA